MAVGGQIVEQTAEAEEVPLTSHIAQGRILLAQPTEPAEYMRIAAESRETADARKGGVEIAEKPMGRDAILEGGAGPQGESESLDVSFEDRVEAEFGLTHGIDGVDKYVRFWTARAYSRHTSWGASWT